jgi:indole-3-glycerol phosphate synthase
MMNILEQIIADKRKEVSDRSKSISVSQLRETPFYKRECISLRESLLKKDSTGIIAEFKRRSPSKGWIFPDADVVEVTGSYLKNGAAALSILTDEQYFGGKSEDLIRARNASIPILRKDFIIDSYQIEESKSIGADVILLIAACLSPGEVNDLAAYAKKIGLEVLLELHDEEELSHICDETEMIGVNNRNLKTFQVDIERSLRMAAFIPDGKVKVAESGIDSPEMMNIFRKAGFSGFLIGEFFMRTNNPGESLANLVKEEAELRRL